jgi:spore coat protein JB
MYNSTNDLFEPYQGFIRGNMFKNLYDGYGKVYDIQPLNEHAELLTYLDMLDFAMIDIGLYLDVFPNDNNMIAIYNNIKEEKNKVMYKYEEKYGPITLNSDELNKSPWCWDKTPWPWEE